MADVEKYLQELVDVHKNLSALQKKVEDLSGYRIERIQESQASMFDRFCPFKVGDRVELAETINMEEGSGWSRSRHYLVKGSPAVVSHRGYYKERFTFEVTFDLESWIPSGFSMPRFPHPVSGRHLYCLNETHLVSSHKPEWIPWKTPKRAPSWVEDVHQRGMVEYLKVHG